MHSPYHHGDPLHSALGLLATFSAWRRMSALNQAEAISTPGMIPQLWLIRANPSRARRSCNLLRRWGVAKSNRVAVASAEIMSGIAAVHSGQFHHAVDRLTFALHICREEISSKRGQAFCLIHRASAMRSLGEFSAASEDLNNAILLAIQCEEFSLYAHCHQSLGSLMNRVGDLSAAARSYLTAAEISNVHGHRVSEHLARIGLMFVDVRRGRIPEVDVALKLQQCLGNHLPLRDRGLFAEYYGLHLSRDAKTRHMALQLYREALRCAQRVGSKSNALEVRRLLAEFWIAQDHPQRAAYHLRAARSLLDGPSLHEDCVALDRLDAEVTALRGNSQVAIDSLVCHAERASAAGFAYEELLSAHSIAVHARRSGTHDVALIWWRRAWDLSAQCGAHLLASKWNREEDWESYLTEPSTTLCSQGTRSAEEDLGDEDYRLPPVDLAAHGIITRSARVREQGAWIGKVARTTIPILIRGESGTGKELVARLVHDLSARSQGPFLAVNCAALPGDIIESELYGHRRGSFTGAITDKQGLFSMADGGTLFLDEIGEMSPQLQAKLLRTLETGELRRVGETKIEFVDVRVVAATHVDLEAAVERGAFRKDLYFRLRGMEINLPPLRERLEDVGPLAEHFLDVANRKTGKSLVLAFETEQWLMGRPWPGNIRELRFTVEQAAALAPESGFLLPRHFVTGNRTPVEAGRLTDEMDRMERARLLSALETTGWNQSEAARLLGLSRTTLIGKLRRLGISRPVER